MSDYFACPNCGAEVAPRALACPECGSDEKTGWSEDRMYDGLDLPDVEALEVRPRRSPFGNRHLTWAVVILTLLAFLWLYLL